MFLEDDEVRCNYNISSILYINLCTPNSSLRGFSKFYILTIHQLSISVITYILTITPTEHQEEDILDSLLRLQLSAAQCSSLFLQNHFQDCSCLQQMFTTISPETVSRLLPSATNHSQLTFPTQFVCFNLYYPICDKPYWFRKTRSHVLVFSEVTQNGG